MHASIYTYIQTLHPWICIYVYITPIYTCILTKHKYMYKYILPYVNMYIHIHTCITYYIYTKISHIYWHTYIDNTYIKITYYIYTYTFLQTYFIYYILHTYIIIHTIIYKCIYTNQTQNNKSHVIYIHIHPLEEMEKPKGAFYVAHMHTFLGKELSSYSTHNRQTRQTAFMAEGDTRSFLCLSRSVPAWIRVSSPCLSARWARLR